MSGRKQAPRPRIRTFAQLRSLLPRVPQGRSEALLCRNVFVVRAPHAANGLAIEYRRKDVCITIARVFRGSDGDTIYVVHGIGQEKNTPRILRRVRIWMKYAPIVTPYPVNKRLYCGKQAYFRVNRGIAVRCPTQPGVWLAWAFESGNGLKAWSLGEQQQFRHYVNFPRRCRVFAMRLRRTLAAMGTPCVVQLATVADWRAARGDGQGNVLRVCTAPSETRDGRQLLVHIEMHDFESKDFHGIDEDFAVKHCQFQAIQPSFKSASCFRWKCASDAIKGIREWMLGGLDISGPG